MPTKIGDRLPCGKQNNVDICRSDILQAAYALHIRREDSDLFFLFRNAA